MDTESHHSGEGSIRMVFEYDTTLAVHTTCLRHALLSGLATQLIYLTCQLQWCDGMVVSHVDSSACRRLVIQLDLSFLFARLFLGTIISPFDLDI